MTAYRYDGHRIAAIVDTWGLTGDDRAAALAEITTRLPMFFGKYLVPMCPDHGGPIWPVNDMATAAQCGVDVDHTLGSAAWHQLLDH